MTWFEFKATLARQLSTEEEQRLREFFESVQFLSDDYEGLIARMRASGRFKSIFGDLGTRRTTNMTTTEPVLSNKELRDYPRDLYKSIIGLAQTRKKPAGLAAAISDFLADKNPQLGNMGDGMSLLVPMEALVSRKAQIAGSAPAGGFLIPDEVSSQIERMLRSASVCVRAGARVLPGLRGDLTLGRETQEVTCEWLSELETVDSGDSAYGAVKLTPHRLVGSTSLSTTLTAQAAPDISAFVVDSLSRGIAAAFDRAAIQGIGATGEPLGLFNRSSVQTVTFGGVATWSKAISAEKLLSAANCDDDSITFIANPDVREKWRTLQRYSGSSTALWEGNLCADRPAYVTTNCPSTKLCAGDFTKMVFATWGEGSPVAVIIDPYGTNATSGKISITASLMGDVGVLREEVFAISTDSAIQ